MSVPAGKTDKFDQNPLWKIEYMILYFNNINQLYL